MITPLARAEKRDALALVEEALKLSSGQVHREPPLLASQLIGRLCGFAAPGVRAFVAGVQTRLSGYYLRPRGQALIPPGGNVEAILGWSTRDLKKLWVSDAGDRAVSYTEEDGILKVWDLNAGSLRLDLQGHRGSLHDAAVTPDCRWAVTNGGDREVIVWNLASGQAVARTAFSAYCRLGITPDGGRIIVWTPDGRAVFFWDYRRTSRPQFGQEFGPHVDSVEVTTDGRFALVTSRSWEKAGPFWKRSRRDKYAVGVYDIDGGKFSGLISGTHRLVLGVGRHSAFMAKDRDVEVWDLGQGRRVHRLAHARPVTAVFPAADGQRLVCLSGKSTITVWDLRGRKKRRKFRAGKRRASCLAVASAGAMAAVADETHAVILLDLKSAMVRQTLKGHLADLKSLAFLGRGEFLMSEDEDEIVRIWDVGTGTTLSRLRGRNSMPVLDQARIMTALEGRTLVLWNPMRRSRLEEKTHHRLSVNQVIFTPDGSRLISGSSDRTIKVWNPISLKEIGSLSGHADSVRCLAVTPDGRSLISSSWDKSVRVWDLAEMSLRLSFKGSEPLILSPGARIIFKTQGGFEERELERGILTRQVKSNLRIVEAIDISPAGDRLIAGGFMGEVVVFDLDGGGVIHPLRGHTESVQAVRFTSDGHRAISAGWDRTLRLWDVGGGKNIFTRVVGGGTIQDAVLVPGHSRAITGSYDGTLAVWDLDHGDLLHRLTGHRGPVEKITILPGGRAVSTAKDGGVRVWDISSGSLLAAFYADLAVSGCAVHPTGNSLAVGDMLGNIHFLELAASSQYS